MLKPPKINWKDTNVALIGSELDHKIKQAASQNEPQWTNIGQKVELRIWRIEQFIVKPWPKKKYGTFHTGDSYVILNTYRKDPSKPKLSHDVHIWIGDESSQDEYGTAAYKMVECDDHLGGSAVQHRETQGRESELFLGYFADAANKSVKYLEGGVESGFRHVEPNTTDPHLFRVKGTKKAIALTQVKVRRDAMNAGDVFILYDGERTWVWNGGESNAEEKAKGMEVARTFTTKTNVVVLDQGVNDGEEEAKEFWKYMPGHVSRLKVFKKSVHVKTADDKDEKVKAYAPTLYLVPDDGKGKVTKVSKATMVKVNGVGAETFRIDKHKLKDDHAYILDTGFHIYAWIGKDTKTSAKVSAIAYTQVYIKSYKRPELAVTMVKCGQETKTFEDFFYDAPVKGCCDSCAIM